MVQLNRLRFLSRSAFLDCELYANLLASVSPFSAVNDACLVFDKQLVIDVNFHTSDPCIRAAGPATKYRRIYYNDKFTHSLCNSLEIGEKVRHALLLFQNQFKDAVS